ncbi:MAG TPA: ribosome maturation factor RimP [Candidatus Limiplasma sp.]|jgi:ribosome maturation factor RimP|nr:ribosome maturation factor RimP [Candidatus Limiplasma sp.]HPR77859.1 ribosome maturation factor RimP [Candidatus Limiplasma sp.]
MKGKQPGTPGKQAAEAIAARVAEEQALELIEVTLKKEPQGLTLCLYIDKPEGVTLDDCERYHRAVQPELDAVEYDFLEVSSPGADRPIQTERDFEKNREARVEVRLYAPVDGTKRFEGLLIHMDDAGITLRLPDGNEKTFSRKTVALVKPIILFEEEEQ